jgi:integrase
VRTSPRGSLAKKARSPRPRSSATGKSRAILKRSWVPGPPAGCGSARQGAFPRLPDHLQKAGHSTANINQVFKILARPCRITADELPVQHNPVGVIKRLRGTASEKETFTPAQVAALLAAAPDAEWRALIALGFYTGARLKDCSRLTWGVFDGPAQTLSFKQQKTGGVVLLPVHPALAAHLQTLPAGVGEAPVLPGLAGRSASAAPGCCRLLRQSWAGIAPGLARAHTGKAGHSVSKLSFHSLRHSFTSELARAGVVPEIRQRLTGHADLTSHKTYTHLELDTYRRAIAALPALPP